MNRGEEGEIRELAFRPDRKDLYDTFRIMSGGRPLRKVAMPALAGLILIGYSLDGYYLKGLLWGLAVAFLYLGLSRGMIFLHVYASSNETLLAPRKIRLVEDRMLVTSEHAREEFPRPEPSQVKAGDRYLVIPAEDSGLVFMKRSFSDPGDFEALKSWARGEGKKAE